MTRGDEAQPVIEKGCLDLLAVAGLDDGLGEKFGAPAVIARRVGEAAVTVGEIHAVQRRIAAHGFQKIALHVLGIAPSVGAGGAQPGGDIHRLFRAGQELPGAVGDLATDRAHQRLALGS